MLQKDFHCLDSLRIEEVIASAQSSQFCIMVEDDFKYEPYYFEAGTVSSSDFRYFGCIGKSTGTLQSSAACARDTTLALLLQPSTNIAAAEIGLGHTNVEVALVNFAYARDTRLRLFSGTRGRFRRPDKDTIAVKGFEERDMVG